MFAPPLPAQHPTLAPHHLPLGIHSPQPVPSHLPHEQPHLPLPHGHEPHEHLRSTSPAFIVPSRPASRASIEFAEDSRSTPMNAVTKQPKLRLQLTLGADGFEAGGNVYGRMELSSLTGKGMRIGEIAVELEAAEELHSRDHSARQTFLYARTLFQGAHLPPSNAVVPQGPITTSSHTHSGTTVWWSARKGKTTFPFSFPVPVRAPSSVQFAGNANLRYILKGTAQIWIASSSNSGSASPHDHQHQQRHLITVRAEVPVVERWPVALARSLPSHPLFYEAIEAVTDTRLFLGGNGAVWLEAGLLRSIFLSGSEMHLRIAVRNNTKRHVSGVKVSLARRLVFPVVRNDERDPGGPGALLRPPAKAYALQNGTSQQPMITEVVCEQVFKSAGGTASQASVNYEFPPNEETVCVLPVRIPHDLRTVGVGVPCGPEHGGEELAAGHSHPHQADPRHHAGSGWSGRSLLFEVQVLLRVSLPLGALAKDLTVELPIWVVHPRSVGADGIKVLMDAHDLALQDPQHQLPGGPEAQHRPKHRQSLDSHSQSYHNVAVARPHSSAGFHPQPPASHQLGNQSPLLFASNGQMPPYQAPLSPSPNSLAPLEQYAIERGWSPAPLAPAHQPLQLPSIAAVIPARPASAMDAYRPLPSPLSPGSGVQPSFTPGMMVALPPVAPVLDGVAGPAGGAGFVLDPYATQWRTSQLLMSSDAASQQAHGIQRPTSAAPDVGASRSRHEVAPVTVMANVGKAPDRQSSTASPQPPALHQRRPSLDHEGHSEVRRSVSGPLPLAGPQIEARLQELPKPSPSPGPHGRAQQTKASESVPKHKHVPTPPVSVISRPAANNGTSTTVAAPAAQRAPPAPADVYAQLAMHTHSRMLSEVPEEGDENEEEDDLPSGAEEVVLAQQAVPAADRQSKVGQVPSRLETSSPAPNRNPTAKDIAALEDMVDSPGGAKEATRSTTPKATKLNTYAAVGTKKSTNARPQTLDRSPSSLSTSSQGAGLDALEARLSKHVAPAVSTVLAPAVPSKLESRKGSFLPETTHRDAARPKDDVPLSTPSTVNRGATETQAKPRSSAPAKYSSFLADETDDEEVKDASKSTSRVSSATPAVPFPKREEPTTVATTQALPIRVYGNVAPATANERRRSVDDAGTLAQSELKTKATNADGLERESKQEVKAAAERERVAQEALAKAGASKQSHSFAPSKVASPAAVPSLVRSTKEIAPSSTTAAAIKSYELKAQSVVSVSRRPSGGDANGSKVTAAKENTKSAIKPTSSTQLRDKRLSLPNSVSASTVRPGQEEGRGSKPLPVPTPSALRSVKRHSLSSTPSKTPSEAEQLLSKRRESLKKVDAGATPNVAPSSASHDRVSAWLSEAANPPMTASMISIVKAAAAANGQGEQGLTVGGMDTIVRRVSAFDMLDAVNRPKTPSASVLMDYQGRTGAGQGSKPLPVPGASSTSTLSTTTSPPGPSQAPAPGELPTMAELLAASGIQPLAKDGDKEGDGSAVGSVNTFKPKARLTGKGGAPALDFSNVSTSQAGVTDINALVSAPALAPAPAAAPVSRPAPRGKTAAAIAAFEIVSGGPRPAHPHELGTATMGTGSNATAAPVMKMTTPKIKPLKKPSSAGVFLNAAAAPQAVFASSSSSSTSASTPTSASSAALAMVPASSATTTTTEADQAGQGATPASGLKVHPYSALALRPVRRQSVDFKGRAAAFEGGAAGGTSSSASVHGSASGHAPQPDGPTSAIASSAQQRHRSRASIDVPPSFSAAHSSASAASTRRVSAGAPPPPPPTTHQAGEDVVQAPAWLDRFAAPTSSHHSSATKRGTFAGLAPAPTSSSAAAAAAAVAPQGPATGAPVPLLNAASTTKDRAKDRTTVDGRGTTRAIGATRLRELRSVWGS